MVNPYLARRKAEQYEEESLAGQGEPSAEDVIQRARDQASAAAWTPTYDPTGRLEQLNEVTAPYREAASQTAASTPVKPTQGQLEQMFPELAQGGEPVSTAPWWQIWKAAEQGYYNPVTGRREQMPGDAEVGIDVSFPGYASATEFPTKINPYLWELAQYDIMYGSGDNKWLEAFEKSSEALQSVMWFMGENRSSDEWSRQIINTQIRNSKVMNWAQAGIELAYSATLGIGLGEDISNVNTVADLLTRLPLPADVTLNNAEIAWMENELAALKSVTLPQTEEVQTGETPSPDTPLTGDALLSFLTDKPINPMDYLGIVALAQTPEEVTSSLTKLFAAGAGPSKPEVSDEEMLSVLNDITPDVELSEAETATFADAIAEIEANYREQMDEQSKMSGIPSPSILSQLSAPFTPLLLALDAYRRWVVTPLAYGATVTAMKILPSDNAAKMIRLYNEAREGSNIWSAASRAWEESELPGWYKFSAEVIADPTTYIGVGIIPRTIGKLGRVGNVIARMDTAIAEFNLIGEALAGVGDVIPKLPSTMATKFAHNATASLARAVQVLTGHSMFRATPEEIFKVMHRAVQMGSHSNSPSVLKELSQHLIVLNELTRDEVVNLARRVGSSKITNVRQLTPEFLEQFHRHLETMIYGGTPDVAQGIANMNTLLAATTVNADDTIKKFAQLQVDRAESFIKSLEIQKNITPYGIWRATSKRAFRNWEDYFKEVPRATSIKTAAQEARGQLAELSKAPAAEGIIARDVGDTRLFMAELGGAAMWSVDRFTQNMVIRAMDRFVVSPMASLYLGFPGYYLFNAVEAVYRSMIGGIWPGTAKMDEIVEAFAPYDNVDPLIMTGRGDITGLGFGKPVADVGSLELWRKKWIEVGKKAWRPSTWRELSDELGAIRSNYALKRFYKESSEALEKLPEAKKIIDDVFKQIDTMSLAAKERGMLKRYVRMTLVHGAYPNEVRGIVEKFTEGRLKDKAVIDIVNKYGEKLTASPAMVLDRLRTGSLWGDLSRLERLCLDAEQTQLMLSGDYLVEGIRQMRADLRGFVIQTPDDYRYLLNAMHLTYPSYYSMPKQALGHAHSLAARMPSNKAKDKLWVECFDSIRSATAELDGMMAEMQHKLEHSVGVLSQDSLQLAPIRTDLTSLRGPQNLVGQPGKELYPGQAGHLSNYTGVGFRQISLSDAEYFLQHGMPFDAEVKLGNHRLTAGAGAASDDVVISMDFEHLSGRLDTSNPQWLDSYNAGDANFVGKFNFPQAYKDSVMEVSVKSGVDTTNLDNLLSGWKKVSSADGSTRYLAPTAKLQTFKALGADDIRALKSIVKNLGERKTIQDNILTESLRYREEFFKGVQKEAMDSTDWARFYEGLAGIYQKHETQLLVSYYNEMLTRLGASKNISLRLNQFPDKSIHAGKTMLSPNEIAEILGGSPRDLISRLTDHAWMQDETLFIGMVKAYADHQGLKGISDECIRASYYNLWANLGITDPGLMNELGIRMAGITQMFAELDNLKNAAMLPQAQRAELEALVDGLAKTSAGISFDTRQAFIKSGQEASDRAMTALRANFSSYDNRTIATQLMRFFFPFWSYEVQRFPQLARWFISKPVIPMTWNKYMKYTDRGYMRIPGTDMEINPLRGTIFMGGFWPLMQDFPEFLDEAGGVGAGFDTMMRFGFYPNAIIMAPFQIASLRTYPVTGNMVPSIAKAYWAIGENIPGKVGDFFKRYRDAVMPSNYTDYQLTDLCAAICQERGLDFTGTDILANKRAGLFDPFGDTSELLRQLNDEDEFVRQQAEKLLLQKSIWEQAMNKLRRYEVPIEAIGAMRVYSEKRQVARDEYDQLICDMVGITRDDLRKLQLKGYRVTDLIGHGFSPAEREILRQTDYRKYWIGTSQALQPLSQQLAWQNQTRFFNAYADRRTYLSNEQKTLDTSLMDGSLTWEEYESRSDKLDGQKNDLFESMRRENPDWQSIPLTWEARMDQALEFGNVPAPRSFVDELLDMYFSLEPAEVPFIDDDGSIKYRMDYDAMYAKRDMIEKIAADWGVADEFEMVVQSKYTTPIQQLQIDMTEKYLRPYWDVDRLIMQSYPELEKQVIDKYRLLSGEDPQTRANLLEQTDENGQKIIAKFTASLKLARERLRQAMPELDYWLWYFGYVDTVKTTLAQAMITDWGRDIRKTPYAEYAVKYPLFQNT